MSHGPVQLACFQADVTPPVGHPLCAGWLEPATAIADPLDALGIVIIVPDEPPIVLCAVDWCEISNESYRTMQQALADAVNTEPARVALHTTHPHCTPWPDAHAQRLVAAQPGLGPVMDVGFFKVVLERLTAALRQAMTRTQPVTHIGVGHARVDRVASNRRIMGDDGRVRAVRWTATPDPAVRREPEGLIDPMLRRISFWNGQDEVAALQYYAVHATSYDDCRITPDFPGLARRRTQREHPDTHLLHFNACAGNITAGKYNDGAPENRAILLDRMARAMIAARTATVRTPLHELRWQTEPVCLPVRRDTTEQALRETLADPEMSSKLRIRAALELAYRRRSATPIVLSALHLGSTATILHLPGEAFIEYQLLAQQLAPGRCVAVASYGDCGPGYICLERSFAEGGYEPRDAFVDGDAESHMRSAITALMTAAPSGGQNG